MNLINTDGISINMLLSNMLAMLAALSIFANTTTSGLPGDIASPLARTTNIEDGNRDRDKSGTSAVQIEQGPSQTNAFTGVTNDDAFVTERAGFEPASRFKPATAFPVLLLQPLGHLSRCSCDDRNAVYLSFKIVSMAGHKHPSSVGFSSQ